MAAKEKQKLTDYSSLVSVKAALFKGCLSFIHKPQRTRLGVLLFGMVFLFSSLLTPLLTSTSASAAPNAEALAAFNDGVTKLLYKNALATCFAYSPLRDGSIALMHDNIGESNAANYRWFSDSPSPGSQPLDIFAGRWLHDAGASGVDEWGRVSCSNPSFIQNAVSALGYSATAGNSDAVFSVMCDIGFRRAGTNAGDDTATCLKNGSGSWYHPGNAAIGGDGARDTFLKSPKAAAVKDITRAQAYLLLFNTFVATCNATISDKGQANLSQGVTDIKVYVDGQKEPVTKNAAWGSDRRSFSIAPSSSDMYTSGIITKNSQNFAPNIVSAGSPVAGSVRIGSSYNGCVEFANKVNELAGDYVDWVLLNGDPSTQSPGGGAVACTQDPTAAGCPSSSTSCAIDGVGWIICPIVNFLAKVSDGAFTIISENLLRTDSNAFKQGEPTYIAWSAIRNIANIIFVIVFLVIIFSQMTGAGISNYGVKKMLPRLVVAAILVNLSFFICQIAVDVSNILGYSISQSLVGEGNSILGATASKNGISPFATGTGFSDIGVLVVAGGIAGVALYALLSVFIPIILAAVVALIMILFMLIARQALIVILVVLAPLAFVAFLLPNTQKLFTQWRKILTALLLLFPIIALVFGLSKLASSVITATFSGDASDSSANSFFGQLIGAAVLVLPLFVVPTLLKKSLDGIPILGQMANKWASRANGSLSNKLKESYKTSSIGMGRALRKQAKDNYRRQSFARKVGSGGLYGALSKGIPLTKEAAYANRAVGRSADAEVREAERKEVAAEQSVLEAQILSGATTSAAAFTQAVAKGDTVKAKAALNIQFQTAGGRAQSHDLLIGAEASPNFGAERLNSLRQHIATSYPGMDAQDSVLAEWSHSKKVKDAAGRDTTTPMNIQQLEKSPEVYKINDTKLAGQKKEGMVEAYNSGMLNHATADRILDSEVLSKDLKPPEREFLQHIRGGGGPRTGATAGPHGPDRGFR